MCGSGRIGLPLVEAGHDYTGLDYSAKLLERFRAKVSTAHSPMLIEGDARRFQCGKRFDLIFIGFHSLSEVVDNQDKRQVLIQIANHLETGSAFIFSLQNPDTRMRSIRESPSGKRVIPFPDGTKELEFSYVLESPKNNGEVVGVQRYAILAGDRVIDRRELPIHFHLIGKKDIETILADTGFRIENLFGDYDGSDWHTDSPFMIIDCRLDL